MTLRRLRRFFRMLLPDGLRPLAAAPAVYLLLAAAHQSSPAQRPAMFGPCIEQLLPGSPAWLFRMSPAGSRREIGVLTNDPPSLCFLALTGGDSLSVVRQLPIGLAARTAAHLDGVPGRNARFALLGSDGDTVRLIRTGHRQLTVDEIVLPGKADGILCADIDSDGDREVAAYGRRIAGLPLIRPGRVRGATAAEPLFPELSASDVEVLDVNGDGVNDILLLDWLNDRLILVQGIGRGTFSEAAEVELPGEPESFSVHVKGPEVSIAVTIPSRRRVAVLSRVEADRLAPGAFCETPWEPETVRLRDVNADGRPDVVCGGAGEIAVFLAGPRGIFRAPLRFHASGTDPLWMLEDLDGDRQAELIIADPERDAVRAVLRSHPARARTPVSYLVGRRTTDVMIAEMSGDRRNDLALTGEGALSFYTQGTGGILEPASAVEIPAGGRRSVLIAGGNRPRCIVSFPRTEELAAVSPGADPPVAIFPAGAEPYVLAAGQDPGSGYSWILSRYRPGTKKEFALAVYEQLNDRQYLERRIESIGVRASAIGAAPGGTTSPATLVVGTRDPREQKIVILAYALGPRGEPSGERTLAVLRDTVGRLVWLRAGDLDRDGRVDLVMGFQHPPSRLAVVYGDDRVAGDIDLVFPGGCAGAEERWLIMVDADGDGHTDLLFPGEGRRTVEVAYGDGPRSFAPSRTALHTGEILAYTAGPLTVNCDLVVASPGGILTVYPTPFRKDR